MNGHKQPKGKGPTGHVYAMRAAGDADGLMTVLRDAGSADERFVAARFLGVLRVSEAEDLLIGALADSDIDVRIAAIRSLTWIGSRKCADELVAILENPDEPHPVRRWAIEGLVNIRDQRAGPYLLEFLRGDHNYRRRWAAGLLGRLAYRAALDDLIEARRTDTWIHRRVYSRAIRSGRRGFV